MNHPVSANLLAIPDGVDAGILRLTVQVSPIVLNNTDGRRAIELEEWPRTITELARSMTIEVVGENSAATKFDCESSLTGFFAAPAPAPDPEPKTRAGLANALWKQVFATTSGFDKLALILSPAGAARSNVQRMACTSVGDLSSIWRALSEMPEAAIESGPEAISAAGKRRSELLRTWLGPLATSGATEAIRERLNSRSHAAAWTDRSSRVNSLVGAIRGYVAGEKGVLGGDEWSTFNDVLDDLLHGLGLDEPMDEALKKDPGEPEESLEDNARRRLLSLQSIPTLSHYVSLAIQLRIPAERLAGIHSGILLARFKDEVRQQCSKTAFEYLPVDGQQPSSYFGPRSEPRNGNRVRYSLRKGCLQFASSGVADPRFKLETVDALNSVLRTVDMLSRSESYEGGELTPETLRRGFVLLDLAKRDADEQQLEEDAEEAADGFQAERVFHAEDLLIGFRPDVALASQDASGRSLLASEERWRPLTVRRVECTSDLIDEAFYDQAVVQEIAHHDHSYTVSPVRYLGNGVDPVTDQDLFNWSGSSLAVTGQARSELDAAAVLGIGIRYEVGHPPANERMAPLREGRGYVVGCRAVYLNGAGLAFSQARHRFSSDRDLLIGEGEGPMAFPAANVQACTVHFPIDDPLVSEAVIDPYASESLTRLVIRDAGKGKPVRRRVVLPARTDFDSAELEGQFDTVKQSGLATPGGMCPKTSASPLLLFAAGGELPEARDGKLWYRFDAPHEEGKRPLIDLVTNKPFQGPVEPSLRGTVAMFRRHASSSDTQYYPSKHGRQIQPSFELTTAGNKVAPAQIGPVAFWISEDPCDALPAVVEFAHGDRDEVTEGKIRIDGSNVQVPSVRVTLKPAATARLTLDTHRPGDCAADGARKQVLELIHAVSKPLRPPSVSRTEGSPPADKSVPLGIHAVTIRVDDDDSAHPNASWAKYQAAHHLEPELKWPSEAGGSVTYFVGNLAIDRASTGQVSLSVTWDEFDESRVVRDPAVQSADAIHKGGRQWKVQGKPMSTPVFTAEVERLGEPDWMSLLNIDTGLRCKPLRGLSCSFADGRARELKLVLRAASRFVNCYPKGSPDEHVVQNAPKETIWTQCTFRPPPPRIHQVTTSLSWSSVKRLNVDPRVVSRSNNVLHIHLDAGWFASGEGEQLGVLLKPDSLGDKDISDFHRPFVSRYARDPVRNGIKAQHGYLAVMDFADSVTPVRVNVVVSKTPAISGRSDDSAALPMDLIPLTPEFDPITGGLVCTIQLGNLDRLAPMLHLGLVRYQKHAVGGLEASTPVTEVVHLQPSRVLTVETGGPNIGSGDSKYYRTITLATPDQHTDSGLERVVDMRLMMRVDQDKRWEQIPNGSTDDGETWPKLNEALPKAAQFTKRLKLPRGLATPKPTFGLILEEYELLASDEDVDVSRETRRMVYSCFVPLGKHGESTW